MIRPMITPLTLYKIDDTIFNGLNVPTRPFTDRGYADLFLTGYDMDKTTLINNILLETAELSVIYTDPAFFKFAVTQWAAKELPIWQSLYETIFFKYNPIWNKDGTIKETAGDLTTNNNDQLRTVSTVTDMTLTDTIDETDTHDLHDHRQPDLVTVTDSSGTNTGTVTEQESNSDTEVHSGDMVTDERISKGNTGTQTNKVEREEGSQHGGSVSTDTSEGTESKVSAFDSSTYQNKDKTSTDRSQTVVDTSSVDTSITETNTRTDNLNEVSQNLKTESDGRIINTERERGTERTDDLRHEDNTAMTETGQEDIDHTGTLQRSGTDTHRNAGSVNMEEGNSGTGTTEMQHELERREFGNIGVTMTQQLIQAERDLVKFNVYDLIIESFKARFCVLIY